jgi:hypothetical protein
MGFESNGAGGASDGRELLNVFALVIYIPEPLGRFLDDLRCELVPDYRPRAHVSVLPPRPLSVKWTVAAQQARQLAELWSPFDIEATEVAIFDKTDVIYLEVGEGADELRKMHREMNTRALEFYEPYPYHPHVTLAQEIVPGRVPELHERALRRWREYNGPRRFRAEEGVFVQSTIDECWLDLAKFSLGAVPAR